jgi:hypothetical protein
MSRLIPVASRFIEAERAAVSPWLRALPRRQLVLTVRDVDHRPEPARGWR